jgi:hypothetical protein
MPAFLPLYKLFLKGPGVDPSRNFEAFFIEEMIKKKKMGDKHLFFTHSPLFYHYQKNEGINKNLTAAKEACLFQAGQGRTRGRWQSGGRPKGAKICPEEAERRKVQG